MTARFSIYNKCLKPDTFLYDYYYNCTDDSIPKSVLFWQGLFVLSTLLQRSVAVLVDDDVIFPNLYCMVVSDSSYSIERYNNYLNTIITKYNDYSKYINSYTTVMGFIDLMTERTQKGLKNCISIVAPSINTILKNKDCVTFLNDMYTCPNERIGYGNKYYNFNHSYFTSYIGCTADDYYSAVGSGLFTKEAEEKTMLIMANKAKPAEEEKRQTNLSQRIQKLKEQIEQPFYVTCTKPAVRLLKRMSRTNAIKRYGYRAYERAAKLSGLLAINENRKEVLEDDVKRAFELLRVIQRQKNIFIEKKSFLKTYENFTTSLEKIITTLKNCGQIGIGHNKLYQKVRYYLTNDEYNQVMTILFEYNLINKYLCRNNKSIIYAMNNNTNALTDKNVEKIIKLLLPTNHHP